MPPTFFRLQSCAYIALLCLPQYQTEVDFDFANALEQIIEWSRHNLRVARQDTEKRSFISQMGNDEAFCIFDCGQEILPRDYRESQRTYVCILVQQACHY
jgi:hypothetical protein